MDVASPRYPVATWVTGALVTLATAVAVRLGAAIADVAVVVPDRAGGAPRTLELSQLVVVTLGVFVVAAAAVVVLDRIVRTRARRTLRLAAYLSLAISLVPVHTEGLPVASRVVLTVLHLVVGVAVVRTVIRE